MGLPRSEEQRRNTLICLLVLGTVALYGPATGFEFVNYDDPAYVVENYRINSGLSWAGLRWCWQAGYAANWHPLTWMSHMLDCQFYGLNPAGHHLTNIGLHAVNAVLVFLICRGMTGATWRSGMVAALFAWHPMHVESVAWIAERKDLLSTFLWLLTLGAYGWYVREERGGRRRRLYICAIGFFALAVMAKPMVVTLPCLLLLLDWWPLRRWAATEGKRGLNWNWLVLEKIPFFVLSAVGCVLTVMAQKRGGAISSLETVSIRFRMYNVVMSYWRYIGKLLMPVKLAVIYPIVGGHGSVLAAAVAGLGLAVVSVVVWRCREKRPYWCVGWFWYLGTLVPVIGVIQVGGQTMADRYTYVPALGLFILGCWTVCDWTKNWRRGQWAVGVAGGVVLGACALVTARQLQYWRNSGTLFSHAIAVTRENWAAHEGYAEYMVENRRWEEAREELHRALEARHDYPEAHLWLGIILYNEGRWAEAKPEVTPSLKEPLLVERAEEYLGKIALKQNGAAEAEGDFRRVLVENPASPGGHCGLGQALARQGKKEEARREFEEALRLWPRDVEALEMMGKYHLRRG